MSTLAQRYQLQSEIFNEVAYQIGCDLRVAVPGIINSFDETKQTVTVKVALREVVNINGVATVKEIPLLLDVPIVVPRAGNFVLTMPVTAGDECLVVFADMCIDSWYTRGSVQNQLERRRHDLSDAFAIIGCWSQPRVIPGYSTSAAELRSEDGTVKVSVEDNQLTVTAPTVNVTASEQVNISGNGTTLLDGKNFLLHEHTGVATGSGISGPVK